MLLANSKTCWETPENGGFHYNSIAVNVLIPASDEFANSIRQWSEVLFRKAPQLKKILLR